MTTQDASPTGLLNPLDTLIRKADQLAVALPAAPLDAYRQLVDTWEQAHQAPTLDDYRTALAACLDAGRDPLDDKTVLRLGALRQLATTEVRALLAEQARRLLRDHAADLFAAFAPALDDAAKDLHNARGKLGKVPLTDVVPDRNKVAAWHLAHAANRDAEQIRTLWNVLRGAGVRFPYDPRYKLLIIADVPPATWEQLRPDHRLYGHMTPWDAVCADLPLSLASPETFRERVQTIRDHEAEELVRRDAEAKTARQRGSQPRPGSLARR